MMAMTPQAGRVGLDHRLLPAMVADELREAIIEGHLEPGERLVEQAIAEQLQVSRIPLREAIAQLEGEGLVRRLPRRGAVVARLTVDIVTDLFDIRIPLEGLAARLAASKVTADGLARLEAHLERARQAKAGGDASLIAKSNVAFHEEVIRLADNQFLSAFMQPLSSQVRWLFRVTGTIDTDVLGREHQSLFDAIAAGDVDRATRLAQEHIEQTRQPSLELISSLDAEPSTLPSKLPNS